jgi:phenylpropionate dioxygenase-like ring-hydroxylating dioxygenase large terminal subunit
MRFNLFLLSGFLNKNFFKFNQNSFDIENTNKNNNKIKSLSQATNSSSYIFGVKPSMIHNNIISKTNLDNNTLYNLNWYVIGESNNFSKNKPYKITIWNKDYVIWKDTENKYFALDNHCSHRGAPLSNGCLLKNNNIMCNYHGYEFNSSGILCKVPGLNFTQSPCKNQNSYNIIEQDNLIYLNTIKNTIKNNFHYSEKINIFQEPEALDNNFRKTMLEFDFNAYARIISENSLDVMHIGFVHTFGNKENPSPIKEIPPYLVKNEINDTSYLFQRIPGGLAPKVKTLDAENPSDFLESGACERLHYRTEYLYQSGKDSLAKSIFKVENLTIHNEFILPHTTIARVIFQNYTSTIITNTLPINITHSKLFVKTYRNFWKSNLNKDSYWQNLFDKYFINKVGDIIIQNMMYNTVLQDKNIIENIKLEYIDGKFNLKFDKLQNVYRTFYKKFILDINK